MNSPSLNLSEQSANLIHVFTHVHGVTKEVVGDGNVFTDGQHCYLVTREQASGLHRLGAMNGYNIYEVAA